MEDPKNACIHLQVDDNSDDVGLAPCQETSKEGPTNQLGLPG